MDIIAESCYIVNSSPLDRVLSRLESVKRSGAGWIARCPAHDDHHPSLSVQEGRDGRVLLKCHAGCLPKQIVRALGLEMRDLFPHDERRDARRTTCYKIKNASGEVIAVHKRIEFPNGSKRFQWLKPDGSISQGDIKPTRLPLYGVHELNSTGLVVVVEGEKARDALTSVGVPAVGTVCGAASTPCDGALKDLLHVEAIYLWPDNDGAGRQHMERIAQRLWALGHKDIRVIAWPEAPKGGDAADLVERAGSLEVARERIASLMEQAELWKPAQAVGYEELRDVFTRWLYLPDDIPLRYVLSLVVANKLEGDPVWGFLIAPPGGTKTELINALCRIGGIYPLSDLTAQTFASGLRGEGVSLLERLPNEAILTLKDFTTVLSMHRDARQVVLAQLREIYDGAYSKEFGTGKKVEWRGKLGLIAGVTPVVDQFTALYSALGERFIQLRISHGSVEELAKKASRNRGRERQMREELADAVAKFFAGLTIVDVPIPDEILEKIIAAARFIALGRSQVIRESYHTRDIELIPEPELPTRVLKQLSNLAVAHAIIMGKARVDSEDLELIARIAHDSIPRNRLKVLLDLRAYGESETTEVAERLGLPTSTTRRLLEDVTALGMAQRIKQGIGQADLWALFPDFAALWEKFAPTSDAHERVENPDLDATTTTLPEKSTGIYREEREGEYHPSDFSGKPLNVQTESAKSTLSRPSDDAEDDEIPF